MKKVMPKIMAEPEIMRGYDVSDKEVSYTIETRKIPLDVFCMLRVSMFFFAHARKLGITPEEARHLKEYFERIDPKKR